MPPIPPQQNPIPQSPSPYVPPTPSKHYLLSDAWALVSKRLRQMFVISAILLCLSVVLMWLAMQFRTITLFYAWYVGAFLGAVTLVSAVLNALIALFQGKYKLALGLVLLSCAVFVVAAGTCAMNVFIGFSSYGQP